MTRGILLLFATPKHPQIVLLDVARAKEPIQKEARETGSIQLRNGYRIMNAGELIR